MRALIVDDESAARRRLSALIEELGIEIAGEAADGMTALELLRERQPDVVLLDVVMPEVDGFDVARHMPEPRPLVIFQTAHAEFAVKAFEHDALDYVVKPVTRERLALAMERARRRLADTRAIEKLTPEMLEKLGSAMRYRPARPERLLVRHGAGHRLVALRDILCFKASEGLVYAHTCGQRAGTDYTVDELETRTAGAFVRASRADLVNLLHVTGIASNGDGSATLSLDDGTSVRVSRRRAAAVRATLER
jgi:two-component system LytT family response regulator